MHSQLVNKASLDLQNLSFYILRGEGGGGGGWGRGGYSLQFQMALKNCCFSIPGSILQFHSDPLHVLQTARAHIHYIHASTWEFLQEQMFIPIWFNCIIYNTKDKKTWLLLNHTASEISKQNSMSVHSDWLKSINMNSLSAHSWKFLREAFLSSADFPQKITYRNTMRSNSLDSDQAWGFVMTKFRKKVLTFWQGWAVETRGDFNLL